MEIERKYKINEEIYENIKNYFADRRVDYAIEHQNDIYFSPKHFPFFGGDIDNEALRIRVLGKKNILSYKKFYEKTDEIPAHSDEHEIEVNDIERMKLILSDLRIEEAFTLKKERSIYMYEGIEVSLDIVDNLGYFVELEIKNQEDIDGSLKVIDKLVNDFSINEDMRNYDGYAYLLYNLNHN